MEIYQISFTLNNVNHHIKVNLNQSIKKNKDKYELVNIYVVNGHSQGADFVRSCLEELQTISQDNHLTTGVMLRSFLPLNGAKNVKVVIMPFNTSNAALKYIENAQGFREVLANVAQINRNNLKNRVIKMITKELL